MTTTSVRPGIADDPAVPSVAAFERLTLAAAPTAPPGADVVGVPVGRSGPVPPELGADRAALEAAGFDGAPGSALVIPSTGGPVRVAVGIGTPEEADAGTLRDAGGSFGRASGRHRSLALALPATPGLSTETAAQVFVEGVLLARYRYDRLRATPSGAPVEQLALVSQEHDTDGVRAGAERGRRLAAATALARDLANTPHSHLSATRLGELAEELGPRHGLAVEVFGEDDLIRLGCGGLLGVNAGSTEPPRMIRLSYRPQDPTGHLALVGKGIMFDAGGLNLKPGDEVHAQMKNDMSGAAAVLAAMCALGDLGCRAAVTGYLMCTDNMPSGTATALGDVLTMRGGTTVEVVNTDAEGRLVMADALVLATEDPTVDAIVDIATLTGACMRALGTGLAGVIGNDDTTIERVRAAAEAAGEPVWQLPLERRYRRELDSDTADLKNVGGANAGAITAALFLEEFVDGRPWAHVDIAGTAQTPADALWHTAGCSGFGARLLAHLALGFASRRP